MKMLIQCTPIIDKDWEMTNVVDKIEQYFEKEKYEWKFSTVVNPQQSNITLEEAEEEKVLFDSDVSPFLECSICCCNYNLEERKPLIFMCGHSICESCCHSYAKNLQCQICRKVMTSIYKTTKDVAQNFEMIKLMEFLIKENRLE